MGTLEQFIRDFEGAIDGIAPGSLEEKTVFRSLKQWDSLAVLMLLDMIDMEHGVRLSSQKIQKAETIEDLYQLVERGANPE